MRRGDRRKRENENLCSSLVKGTNSALRFIIPVSLSMASLMELPCPHLLLLRQQCFQLLLQPTVDWLASDQWCYLRKNNKMSLRQSYFLLGIPTTKYQGKMPTDLQLKGWGGQRGAQETRTCQLQFWMSRTVVCRACLLGETVVLGMYAESSRDSKAAKPQGCLCSSRFSSSKPLTPLTTSVPFYLSNWVSYQQKEPNYNRLLKFL